MTIRREVQKAKSSVLYRARTQQPYRRRFVATLLACGACCVWLTSPVAAAAAVRAPHYAKAPTGRFPQLPGTIEPQVCASCTPPLVYYGGPVMNSNGANGVTITPIWWQPSGGRFFYPSFYRDLIDQYITDIAVASGSTDNVYSIDTEYYDKVGGVKTYMTYKLTAGTPLEDTDAFPANGCKQAPGYFGVPHRRPVARRAESYHEQPEVAHDAGLLLPGLLAAGRRDRGRRRVELGQRLLRLPPRLRFRL